MSLPKIEVLYEDNHLLAINKPPGLPTMGVREQDASLVRLAKQYIKHRYQKPGNVYLGVMSRLDAASSGIVLLARTSKAAARLTEQFRSRNVEKTYWAIAGGQNLPPQGEMVDWLIKNEAKKCMAIANPGTSGAKEARLTYRRLRSQPNGWLVEIDLLTGRKHQIRLQFASRGWTLWGEMKYGRGHPFGEGIALHSRRLVVVHPVRKERLELIASLPHAWQTFGLD